MDHEGRPGRTERLGRRPLLATLGVATLGGVTGCLGGGGGDGTTEADGGTTTTDEQVPGLRLSLRADAGVTTDDQGRVETWADRSPNGNDFSADDPTSRPTLTEDAVNGRPALTFDGEDDQFVREDTLGIANDSPRTFVVVNRVTDTKQRSPFVVQGKLGSLSQHYGMEANTFNTTGERFGVYFVNRSYDSNRETDTNYHVQTLRTGSFSSVGEIEKTTTYYIDGAETSLTGSVINRAVTSPSRVRQRRSGRSRRRTWAPVR